MNFKNLVVKLSNKILGMGKPTKPFTIVIEGNIGSGKTTFLNHFKKFDSVCVLDEPVEQWRNCDGHNLLALMYNNPREWSFSLQSYIQLTMLKLHLQETTKPVKVMERSIFSARYCFVEKLSKDNLLPPPSKAVIDEWFKWINTNSNLNVDLIIYLRTSPEVVYQRMLERNREEERTVPLSYLQDLHDIHEQWLCHKTLGHLPAQVIILNADMDKQTITSEFEKYDNCILSQV